MPVTHYRWDHLNDTLLSEQDENGTTIATYTNGPRSYDAPVSMRRSGQMYNYHYDGAGNVTAVTDSNQNVVESATFTAFGEVVAKTSTVTNPFGFRGALGYYANVETGSHYVKDRSYSASLARWLSLLFGSPGNGYLVVLQYGGDGEVTGFGGVSICRVHNTIAPCQQIPAPDIPFPEDPNRPPKPPRDFPPLECLLKEIPCRDLTWFPDLCPQCKCGDTRSGDVGMTNQDCGNKLRSEIDSIPKCANIVIGNVVCSSLPWYSATRVALERDAVRAPFPIAGVFQDCQVLELLVKERSAIELVWTFVSRRANSRNAASIL